MLVSEQKTLFVETARGFLGTKWHHQGRNEFGLDCIGLPVVSAARGPGIILKDCINYRRQPDGTLNARLAEQLIQKDVSDLSLGTIITLWFSENTKVAQHVAIITAYGIIHTHEYVGKVVEHRLNDMWKARVSAAFELQWQL